MKKKLIICLTLIVFLLSGCRSLGGQKTETSATPSAAASSALSGVTNVPVSASSDINTAVPSASLTPSASDTPDVSLSPSAEAPPVASPTEKMAPKESVSETLDDILKELNDLDKLYSQMDDLSESDLK